MPPCPRGDSIFIECHVRSAEDAACGVLRQTCTAIRRSTESLNVEKPRRFAATIQLDWPAATVPGEPLERGLPASGNPSFLEYFQQRCTRQQHKAAPAEWL